MISENQIIVQYANAAKIDSETSVAARTGSGESVGTLSAVAVTSNGESVPGLSYGNYYTKIKAGGGSLVTTNTFLRFFMSFPIPALPGAKLQSATMVLTSQGWSGTNSLSQSYDNIGSDRYSSASAFLQLIGGASAEGSDPYSPYHGSLSGGGIAAGDYERVADIKSQIESLNITAKSTGNNQVNETWRLDIPTASNAQIEIELNDTALDKLRTIMTSSGHFECCLREFNFDAMQNKPTPEIYPNALVYDGFGTDTMRYGNHIYDENASDDKKPLLKLRYVANGGVVKATNKIVLSSGKIAQ